MIQHRATCEAADCGRFWRENCADCLQEVADRHRVETGHQVSLTIVLDDDPLWELRQLTRRVQPFLVSMKRKERGW